MSVIVVDDDAGVRQALSLYLATFRGCCVTAAADLKSPGAALVAPGAPRALLIADLNLAKGEAGLDPIHVARDFDGQTVPTVLLAGDCSFSFNGLSAMPALRVLTKPFEFDAFSAALNEPIPPDQSAAPL